MSWWYLYVLIVLLFALTWWDSARQDDRIDALTFACHSNETMVRDAEGRIGCQR